MRVLVFAHALRVGGGRVTCMNILGSLKQADEDVEYSVVVPDQPAYRALRLESAGHEVRYYRRRLGYFGRLCFDGWTRRRIVRDVMPDVVWSMGGLGLTHPPCPQAVSIQNPYVMYEKRDFGRIGLVDRMWVRYWRWAFRRQLADTDLVICQTRTMEHRLRATYRYGGRTLVTLKSVSAYVDAEAAAPPERLAACAAGRFKLFYLTRYYPHKGLETLVDMMAEYPEELADAVVVITIEAGQHRRATRLLKRIEDRGLGDRVINVGPLKQEELASYYRACDCLVMPTTLESFSSTYLEAMRFGLPILTSDLDFAHEICGDAALYFDPWDPESIVQAVLRLKGDPRLGEDLVARGRERLLDCFGQEWAEIAREIVNGLQALVPSSGELELTRFRGHRKT